MPDDRRSFDAAAWRREYMRMYMRKKRERLREAKALAKLTPAQREALQAERDDDQT
jgi:hypothetical protein